MLVSIPLHPAGRDELQGHSSRCHGVLKLWKQSPGSLDSRHEATHGVSGFRRVALSVCRAFCYFSGNGAKLGAIRRRPALWPAFHRQRRLADVFRRSHRFALFAPGPDQRLQLQQAGAGLALQDRRAGRPSGIQAGRHAAGGQRHGLHHRRFAPRRGGAGRQDRRTEMGL